MCIVRPPLTAPRESFKSGDRTVLAGIQGPIADPRATTLHIKGEERAVDVLRQGLALLDQHAERLALDHHPGNAAAALDCPDTPPHLPGCHRPSAHRSGGGESGGVERQARVDAPGAAPSRPAGDGKLPAFEAKGAGAVRDARI